MSDNPFADAIKPGPPPPTQEATNHPHFYQSLHDQQELARKARNMTREDMFRNGLIKVEDLDDEELRYGRCRDGTGRIPKPNKRTEMVPRDLYDEMVAEHAKRFDERLRQQLDTALDTMADIMTDETAEPKDKMEAAKWFVERVRGKTPDRVAVSITKAPWEELLGDVAHVTRAQHMALKQGTIDVESFEIPVDEQANPSDPHEGQGLQDTTGLGATQRPTRGTDVPNVQGVQSAVPEPQVESQTGPTGSGEVPNQADRGTHEVAPGEHPASAKVDIATPAEQHIGDSVYESPCGDPRITVPPDAPNFARPAHSNPVVEVTLSEQLREAQEEQERIAEARTRRQKLISEAKRKRKAMRAKGVDVFKRHIDAETFGRAQDRFNPDTARSERDDRDPE